MILLHAHYASALAYRRGDLDRLPTFHHIDVVTYQHSVPFVECLLSLSPLFPDAINTGCLEDSISANGSFVCNSSFRSEVCCSPLYTHVAAHFYLESHKIMV